MNTHTRTGNIGKPLTSSQAVQVALIYGWNVKETSWQTGWPMKRLYRAAAAQGKSFAYCGQGPHPKYPQS